MKWTLSVWSWSSSSSLSKNIVLNIWIQAEPREKFSPSSPSQLGFIFLSYWFVLIQNLWQIITEKKEWIFRIRNINWNQKNKIWPKTIIIEHNFFSAHIRFYFDLDCFAVFSLHPNSWHDNFLWAKKNLLSSSSYNRRWRRIYRCLINFFLYVDQW